MADKKNTADSEAILAGAGIDTSLLQGGGAQLNPIGLAPGVQVSRAANPFTNPSGPTITIDPNKQFQEGDENALLNLPPLERFALVKRLDAIGVYKAAGVKSTSGDPLDHVKAYRYLLEFGNAVGATNPDDAIRHWVKFGGDAADAGFGGGGLADSLPAPEDVRQSVEDALIARLGKAPRDAVESMMAGYNSAYAARSGGTTGPPSVDAFVESQVGETTEAQSWDLVNKMDTLLGLTGPGVPGDSTNKGPF